MADAPPATYWRIVDLYPNKPKGYPKESRYRAEIWLGDDRPSNRTIDHYQFKVVEENGERVVTQDLSDDPIRSVTVTALNDVPEHYYHMNDPRIKGAGYGDYTTLKSPRKARKWLRKRWDRINYRIEANPTVLSEGMSRP